MEKTMVLGTDDARKTYLGMRRALLDLDGDGSRDLQAGEEVTWGWCPNRAPLFDRVAERFPRFKWEPVTRATKKRDGSVVLRKFVRFTAGFPTKGNRTLTAEELLTVDPTTVDPPREKKRASTGYTGWKAAASRRRAEGRGDSFV